VRSEPQRKPPNDYAEMLGFASLTPTYAGCHMYSRKRSMIHREKLRIHREKFPIHREKFPIHREKLPIHREKRPIHREKRPIHREKRPIHREKLRIHREKLPIHREKFPILRERHPPEREKRWAALCLAHPTLTVVLGFASLTPTYALNQMKAQPMYDRRKRPLMNTQDPMTRYIEPTQESGRAFVMRGMQGNIVMLNLLRFREVADYTATPELTPDAPISGAAAFQRYIDHTLPYLRESGGDVLFLGAGGLFLIGPPGERWDMVMLIRQNSVESFLAFASHKAYLAGMGHRTAAIEDSRLLPLSEIEASPHRLA
jgi:hypothetical protein